jgi:hypothetical protein
MCFDHCDGHDENAFDSYRAHPSNAIIPNRIIQTTTNYIGPRFPIRRDVSKASIKVEKVKKTIEVEEEVKTLDLSLSMDEAKTLHDILRKVGGDPDCSRRGHAQDILLSLRDVLDNGWATAFYEDMDHSSRIYFKNNKVVIV